MPSMKRPAASGQEVPSKKQRKQVMPPMTKTMFCLVEFLNILLQSLGLVRNSAKGRLMFASACSGSGAPSIVLRELLGESGVTELFGSDVCGAAAHAFLQNCKVEHVFADAAAAATPGYASAFCVKHNRCCCVPRAQQHLFIAGFSCQSNSRLNCQRYEADPRESAHWKTFLNVVNHIRLHKPDNYILENVGGVLHKVGGSGPDKDKKLIDFILQELEALPDYNCTWLEITAHPLPTSRPRIYFLGSRKHSTLLMKSEVLVLQEHVKKMPIHHVSSFVHENAMWDSLEILHPPCVEHELTRQAAYATAVAKSREKAGKRLSSSSAWLDPASRESKHYPWGTPWIRAQIDVFQAILSEEVADHGVVGDARYGIADCYQTAGRGNCMSSGSVPTLTTSSRLLDYHQHKFLHPNVLMFLHGFKGYNFVGCTRTEACAIVGNSMAATSLAIVAVPVLKASGFLTAAPQA